MVSVILYCYFWFCVVIGLSMAFVEFFSVLLIWPAYLA